MGLNSLISRSDAVRIAIQNKLAAKPTKRESVQIALVDYYAFPDRKLLWVDDNGLIERSKGVMAEIGKADDYGLRASDYKLPDADGFNPLDGSATDWLADTEIRISNAVLDYANDARGGRLDPQRLSKNLDPNARAPQSRRGPGIDRHTLGPCRLSTQLPAGPAAIRGAAQEADRASRRRVAGARTA